ncbi:hypothetical protein [Maribacter antarcticus]|nr:hypothetical protein [Maribacter antarcticus]
MKKITFISGVLGASLILGGLTGELMHLEYNGTTTAIGAFIFTISCEVHI